MQVKALIALLTVFLCMKLAKAECEIPQQIENLAFEVSCRDDVYTFTEILMKKGDGIFPLLYSQVNVENFCYMLGLQLDRENLIVDRHIIARRALTVGGEEFKSNATIEQLGCIR